MASRSRLPRRRWSVAFKKRVVAEANRPGTSAAEVARHYGLNPSLLLNWKKKYGTEVALVPVEIVSDSDQSLSQWSCHRSKDYDMLLVGQNASGVPKIVLPCKSTVRCGSDVNPGLLTAAALTALRPTP